MICDLTHINDDDANLAETLLNIKRSTSKDKGKGIMQETELPKKIKRKDKGKGIMHETKLLKKIRKREMTQLSLDEELAQKLHAEELANETTRQEQEKYNLEKALKLQKQLDQRDEDVDKGDQTQDINWNDPEVLRYHALHNRVFSKAEGMGSNSYFFPKDSEIEKEVMKRSGFHLQQESLKKQKYFESLEG
nr:hypothetical protein [Tanacetum cinerariifolium]